MDKAKRLWIAAAVVVSILAVGLSAVPQESPCIECHKAAKVRVEKCINGAKTESAKSECNKLAARLTKECQDGVCKK